MNIHSIIRAIKHIPYNLRSLWSKLTTDNWYSDYCNVGYSLAKKFLSLTIKKTRDSWYSMPNDFEKIEDWLDVVKEMRFHFFYNVFVDQFCIYWHSAKGREKAKKKYLKEFPYLKEEIEFYWFDLTYTQHEEDWELDFNSKPSEEHKGCWTMEFILKNVYTGQVANAEDLKFIKAKDLFLEGYKDRARKGSELFHKYFWNIWD